MLYVALVIGILYCLLLLTAVYFWNLPFGEYEPACNPPSCSIIIPFRNEAQHLEHLISQLSVQLKNKPIQVIFVNDQSTDDGEKILKDHPFDQIKVIDNQGVGKKDAIKTALTSCSSEDIIQIDADVIIEEGWLDTLLKFKQRQPEVFLTAPVCIFQPSDIISHFQQIEQLSLMGMTHLGHQTGWWQMANGANMAYTKSMFENVNKKHHEFASGDDMFLAESAHQQGFKAIFIKDPKAILHTYPLNTWTKLFHQHLRWAGKNKSLHSIGLKLGLSIVIMMNAMLVCLTILSIGASERENLLMVGLWGSKILMDAFYLTSVSPFFNYKIPWVTFIICSLIYPIFLCLVGFRSLFSNGFTWKNRVTK